jgi:SAM-dependent methyltransferase
MSLPALTLAQIAFNGENIIENMSDEDTIIKSASGASTSWVNLDLLTWATSELSITVDGIADQESNIVDNMGDDISGNKFDIVICAFSVHHLNDEDKKQYLQGIIKNRLNQDGIILMADIFRIDGEDREGYISRFASHIEGKWNKISDLEKIGILKHVTENDYPASLPEFLNEIAPSCGLSCEVLWTDTGNFEKLVLLKPL